MAEEPAADVEARIKRVDESIAKQLQGALERNGRMVVRLQKLAAKLKLEADPTMRDAADDIDEILKDQDPF